MTERNRIDTSPWASLPVEREIVIAKVVSAEREKVFRAWTDPAQIVQWFGPEGFQIETHEIEIREGGLWRFDMISPDGERFSNRMEFLRVTEPSVIEATHGADVDNDPDCFRLMITFDAQANGKTVVTLRQMHPTPERRLTVIKFGAVEFGTQTLNKLDNHLTAQA